MPAKSEKQRRFMAAVANNPKFANKVGVPQSVGEEFMKKSKNYMGGGMMKRYAEGGKLDMVEKDGKMVPFYAADGKGKMMGGGKVMKYAEGDIIGASPSGSGDEITRGPRDRAAEIKAGVPSDSLPEDGREVGKIPAKKKPVKKPVNKMGGGMMKYNKGGKVRGCGMARRKRG
jgi:hypothetical protein